jgi:nitroreductase
MTHPTLNLIVERTSINRFDPSHAIDDATIQQLVRYASEAPSAYNFQNWRFIAVRTPAQRMHAACDQIGESASTLL